MTIDEAIKILTDLTYHGIHADDQNLEKAHQLGIEALKLVKGMERFKSTPYYGLLPGETEETSDDGD